MAPPEPRRDSVRAPFLRALAMLSFTAGRPILAKFTRGNTVTKKLNKVAADKLAAIYIRGSTARQADGISRESRMPNR
jgi:hypothetical protein